MGAELFCAGNGRQTFVKINNFEILLHQIRPLKTAENNEHGLIRKSRIRVNHKHNQISPYILEGPRTEHFDTLSLKRSTCKYCSYEMVCLRANGSNGTPPRVSNVYRMCVKCNVHLCVAHFQPYHDQGDDNSIHSSTIDDEIGETDQLFFKAFFIR